MKKHQKIIAFVMFAVFSFVGLTGCGKKDEPANPKTQDTQAQSEVEPPFMPDSDLMPTSPPPKNIEPPTFPPPEVEIELD